MLTDHYESTLIGLPGGFEYKLVRPGDLVKIYDPCSDCDCFGIAVATLMLDLGGVQRKVVKVLWSG